MRVLIASDGPSLLKTWPAMLDFDTIAVVTVNRASDKVANPDWVVGGDRAVYPQIRTVPRVGYCAPSFVLSEMNLIAPVLNVAWEELKLPCDAYLPIECNTSIVAALALSCRLAGPNGRIEIHGADMSIEDDRTQNRGRPRWEFEWGRMCDIAAARVDCDISRVLPVAARESAWPGSDLIPTEFIP